MADNDNLSNRCISISMESSEVICEKETISLPTGKQFHVFFSYRDVENDRTWVLKLLHLLENEYKLICCDHLRDFEPGRPIIENIELVVPNSIKTIVVLSKEYANSHWCKYEMEYTLCMSMAMRQNLVLPVLIEDCEIPDYLKPLTYLDARGDIAAWLPKLLKTIRCGGDSYQRTYRSNQVKANYSNLSVLHSENATTRYRYFGKTAFRDKYLVPSIINSEISTQEYNNLRQMVESLFVARGMGPCEFFFKCAYFISVMLFAAGLSMTVIYLVGSKEENSVIGIGITFIVMAVLNVTLSKAVYWYLFKHKGKKEVMSVNVEAQKIVKDYNMMITIKYTALSLMIIFRHYDWKPCVIFATESFRANSYNVREMSAKDSKNTIEMQTKERVSDEQMQEEAENMLVELSALYLNDFNNGTLPIGSRDRHCNIAICLCEYAEKKGKLPRKL